MGPFKSPRVEYSSPGLGRFVQSMQLREDEVFDGLFSAPLPESEDMGPWKQPILRAIQEFKRNLGRDDAFKLYIPLAKQFNPKVTNDAVERIFKQAKDRGFDVLLEPLAFSVMQALPYPNARHPDLQKPVFVFDTTFAFAACNSEIKENRQEYLHLVKLFHEFGHMLTPGLIESKGEINAMEVVRKADEAFKKHGRKAREAIAVLLDTPPNLRTVVKGNRYAGDCGTEWEELECGGRVVTEDGARRLAHELVLKCRRERDGRPTHANVITYKVSDGYISGFLATLRTGENLPSFKIPECHLTTAGKRAQESATVDRRSRKKARSDGGADSAEGHSTEENDKSGASESEVDEGESDGGEDDQGDGEDEDDIVKDEDDEYSEHPRGSAFGISLSEEEIRRRDKGFKS
jgi:hypothetical protein